MSISWKGTPQPFLDAAATNASTLDNQSMLKAIRTDCSDSVQCQETLNQGQLTRRYVDFSNSNIYNPQLAIKLT